MNDAHERREALEEICRRFGVAILYSFGSRGKEALHWLEGRIAALAPAPPGMDPDLVSDLDIGMKRMPGVALLLAEQIRLTIALENLFSVARVDLVVLDQADPFLAANIIRGERLFADNQHAADEYDLYVLRRAGDLIPFERQRIAQILRESSDQVDRTL